MHTAEGADAIYLFSGCKKKREAVELHAFPETHSNTAQYFHQFCFTYSGRALPYLLLGDSRWPYPSCLCDCQGTVFPHLHVTTIPVLLPSNAIFMSTNQLS
jgi:hypothetical protein